MTINEDALISELDVIRAETAASKQRQATIDKELGPGKVYQGVSKTIRTLTASGQGNEHRERKLDPDEYAGVIALARATARTVDKMTGHNVTGWHANGRDLAPMLEQLRELLAALQGDEPEADALLEWLRDDSAPTEVSP